MDIFEYVTDKAFEFKSELEQKIKKQLSEIGCEDLKTNFDYDDFEFSEMNTDVSGTYRDIFFYLDISSDNFRLMATKKEFIFEISDPSLLYVFEQLDFYIQENPKEYARAADKVENFSEFGFYEGNKHKK